MQFTFNHYALYNFQIFIFCLIFFLLVRPDKQERLNIRMTIAVIGFAGLFGFGVLDNGSNVYSYKSLFGKASALCLIVSVTSLFFIVANMVGYASGNGRLMRFAQWVEKGVLVLSAILLPFLVRNAYWQFIDGLVGIFFIGIAFIAIKTSISNKERILVGAKLRHVVLVILIFGVSPLLILLSSRMGSTPMSEGSNLSAFFINLWGVVLQVGFFLRIFTKSVKLLPKLLVILLLFNTVTFSLFFIGYGTYQTILYLETTSFFTAVPSWEVSAERIALNRYLHEVSWPFAVAVVGINIALLIFGRLFFQRIVLAPLTNLVTGIDRVKAGDFSIVVENLSGGDEIGAMTQSFNKLVATMQDTQANLEAENVRLEQTLEEKSRALEMALDNVGRRRRIMSR